MEGLEKTGDILVEAAGRILERMFFTLVDQAVDQADTAPPEAQPQTSSDSSLAAEIAFRGTLSGRLRLVATALGARELAVSFMGAADPAELTSGQISEVLQELSNMVCGSTLSRLAPRVVFDLESPEPLPPGRTQEPPNRPTLARRLKTGSGWIDLYWFWDAAGGARDGQMLMV